MAEYPLTVEQKNMLRRVVEGIDDSKIPQTWTYFFLPSSRQDRSLETRFGGIPLLEELDVQDSDLSLFAELGFLTAVKVTTKGGTYYLKEQALRIAVESDFMDPESKSQSPTVQAIFNAPVYGAIINVAQIMERISQNLGSMPTLSSSDRATIDALISEISEGLSPFQESHPREVRDATRSVELVMSDLADEPIDRKNIRDALTRLRRTGVKVAFAHIAQDAINRLAEFIENLSGGFS
jgi:hypothetical protein